MSIKTSLSHRSQEPEKSVLYMVGTPIGNLYDISYRALKILKNVSLIVCEDTRQTRKIMQKFEFNNKLMSFNKYNSHKKISQIINALKEGKSIALVSDAGMPSICDPGEELAKEAKLNSIDVICIPGPCAAITALISSGFSSSKFVFEGFFPKKKNLRKKLLFKMTQDEKTTILYESPLRLKKLLKELKEYLGGERKIQISREITKKYEEHIGPDINAAINYFESIDPKGEFTIVVEGTNQKQNEEIDIIFIKQEVKKLVDAGLTFSAAAKYLAKRENFSKNIIYDIF